MRCTGLRFRQVTTSDETEATDSTFENIELTKVVQNNETTWFGTVAADGQNLMGQRNC